MPADGGEADVLAPHQVLDGPDRLRGAFGRAAVRRDGGAVAADDLMGAVGHDHMDVVALEIDADQLGAAGVERDLQGRPAAAARLLGVGGLLLDDGLAFQQIGHDREQGGAGEPDPRLQLAAAQRARPAEFTEYGGFVGPAQALEGIGAFRHGRMVDRSRGFCQRPGRIHTMFIPKG